MNLLVANEILNVKNSEKELFVNGVLLPNTHLFYLYEWRKLLQMYKYDKGSIQLKEILYELNEVDSSVDYKLFMSSSLLSGSIYDDLNVRFFYDEIGKTQKPMDTIHLTQMFDEDNIKCELQKNDLGASQLVITARNSDIINNIEKVKKLNKKNIL